MSGGVTTYDIAASLNSAGKPVAATVANVTNITGAVSVIGAPGPAGATGATGPAGPAGVPGAPLYIDIADYGAIGNGAVDNTVFIQNAINAAHAAQGGTVFVPVGNYKITGALTLYTGVSVLGEGSEASQITQANTAASVFTANDAASISLTGLYLDGPGSGTGVGVNFGWTGAGNVPYLNFTDLKVYNFGSDGIAIETPIVSSFTQVVCKSNGGYGVNFYHAGTSCVFNDCWMRLNAFAGYHFYQSVYMSLNGCAADNNGVGYLVESAQSINFNGCGAETQVVGAGAWDGTGFKISNSSVVGIHNAWITGNPAVGIWVTNGSIATEIFGAADNSPGVGATAFVKTDVSTNTTLSDVHNTTANSYSAGTVTVLNDGANGMLTKQLTVKDSSGSMILTAASDGGEYNLEVDTSGTLALYGQGGQHLNVDLLDGNLTVASGTTTLGGGLLIPVVVKSGNYIATASDSVILVSGTTAITLPTAVGITGYAYNIKNTGSNTVTINTTSSQTIDGSLTATMSVTNTNLTVVSDGANWRVI